MDEAYLTLDEMFVADIFYRPREMREYFVVEAKRWHLPVESAYTMMALALERNLSKIPASAILEEWVDNGAPKVPPIRFREGPGRPVGWVG